MAGGRELCGQCDRVVQLYPQTLAASVKVWKELQEKTAEGLHQVLQSLIRAPSPTTGRNRHGNTLPKKHDESVITCNDSRDKSASRQHINTSASFHRGWGGAGGECEGGRGGGCRF